MLQLLELLGFGISFSPLFGFFSGAGCTERNQLHLWFAGCSFEKSAMTAWASSSALLPFFWGRVPLLKGTTEKKGTLILPSTGGPS